MEKEGIPEDRVNIMAQSGDIHSRDIKPLINAIPAQKNFKLPLRNTDAII